MITLLNLLFPLVLALTSPASAPSLSNTPAAAAGYVPHCPCDIGHKEW
ncbi:MAG: hypothetical protein M3Y27_12595 [Acidobacteriota bacterium]|nr:hypothetical protein [Acidobacteriota bacterium]